MDYELFHDESKENGYWHGMLLIPSENKELLFELLQRAREKTGYRGNKTFKEIRKRGQLFDCKRAWFQIGLMAMQTQKFEGFPIDWGSRCGVGRFEYMTHRIGAKFILLREIDNFKYMYDPLDFAGNVETTFRFGLKGGLHFLGSDEKPIRIKKIHFDGYEHYHRMLSRDRILGRLNGLRSYVAFDNDNDIIDCRSGKATNPNCQSYEDCELLLLTDLFISGFRTALHPTTNILKNELAYFPRQLLHRYYQGYSRMKNSRWFNSFCISQCYLDAGTWDFATIEITNEYAFKQLELGF